VREDTVPFFFFFFFFFEVVMLESPLAFLRFVSISSTV